MAPSEGDGYDPSMPQEPVEKDQRSRQGSARQNFVTRVASAVSEAMDFSDDDWEGFRRSRRQPTEGTMQARDTDQGWPSVEDDQDSHGQKEIPRNLVEARTRQLVAEEDLSWHVAWLRAESELGDVSRPKSDLVSDVLWPLPGQEHSAKRVLGLTALIIGGLLFAIFTLAFALGNN